MGVALAGLAVALALPAPARAHAQVIDADPAPNSVVPAAPPELALFFSEPVDPDTATVRVLSITDEPIGGVGKPRLDGSGLVLRADLPELASGTYIVEYAVVSAIDGHPTESRYAFVVDPTGQQPPPINITPQAEAPPDPVAVAARWVVTIAALVLLGSVLVWLLHRRWIGVEASQPVPWGILAGLALVGLIGLAVYLGRTAAVSLGATGHAHEGGFPFDPAAPFGWTPFAIAMRVAVAGAGGVVLLTATVGAGAGRQRLVGVGAGAVMILAGLSLTGHAAALGGPLGAAMDLLHLVAIATWLGALPALGLLAWRVARNDSEAMGMGRRALAVHARLALVAAPLVVLTGLANSPLVVGDARELVAAGYGNLLLAKAWLVSVALGLGAANFFLARTAGGRRVAAVLSAELVVAAVAVAIGATLVSIEPAADRAPALVDPHLGVAHLYGATGGSSVHGIVDLPEPGIQSYTFAVSDSATGAARHDVRQVTVVFHPPGASGLPSDAVLATPGNAPWIWVLRGAYTPAVGSWELDVIIQRGRLVEEHVVLPLDVRRVLRPSPLPPPTVGGSFLGVLAAPARWLPAGPAGWGLPVGVVAIAGALFAIERRRPRGPLVRWARLALVGAAVVAGLSLTARDVVAIANRPPTVWLSAVNPLGNDPGAVAAGDALYRANCASCHGLSGAGDGPAADGLWAPPEDLALVVPNRRDGELAWTIAAGVAGTQMPTFGTTLLEGERWELVSFLRSRWPSGNPSQEPP